MSRTPPHLTQRHDRCSVLKIPDRVRPGGPGAHLAVLTEHINRFGEYSTHELGIQPEAYDPKLDVDFTPLREQDLTARRSRPGCLSREGTSW
ncbi:hypothetical protein WDA79_09185 [Streptomyces sp. A475]|uniref:hypothetical protein n=1 Tax=Streptomyces sp. A475 TaxID=3131976 RepID=UPI0030C93E47